MARRTARETFNLVLIKPSHYDDDGYVIQWVRSPMPSNTLAVLYGLACDCRDRKILGDAVDLVVTALDETNTRIKPRKIIERIRVSGACGMVGLVGVQSNEFPRAVDIARPIREAGIPVCIGGFHVSGCLAVLPEVPGDIQEALSLGLSVFAGEAEGRLEEILWDAYRGDLKPVYDATNDLPDLAGVALPVLPGSQIKRIMGKYSSFDAGRGCPFKCSFCTIINVQGRKSRQRSPTDIERIVRANVAQGVSTFFITDDNFARNKNWESIFDRLIQIREETGVETYFTIQVDSLCHRITGFIEKAARAGVMRVFIGLESINPESLKCAQKRQNLTSEYRQMLQKWKSAGVITVVGYILGFPGDTPESIARDIEIIKRELPIDVIEFFCLTPLPGSADHRVSWHAGIWMEPDMNKYDLEHVTIKHPLMSKEEWRRAYQTAWTQFYTPEHIETVMRRAGTNCQHVGMMMLRFYGCVLNEGLHPLHGGYLRRKYRRDRRPGLPLERPFAFHMRYIWELIYKHFGLMLLIYTYWRLRRRIDTTGQESPSDVAMALMTEDEIEESELFSSKNVRDGHLDVRNHE